jgi:hypothetical protein
MTLDAFTLATWSLWLAIPTTALDYWRAWDRLPTRVAVHFDASFRPDGWTSREGALTLGLLVITFIVVVSTVAALVTRARKRSSAWTVLIVSYLSLGAVWAVTNWIVLRSVAA